MNEINRRKCRVCGEEKNRIAAGKFPNNRDKKWAGDNGKLWNGKVCPECNVSRAGDTMKKLRSNEKAI
jgi:hypothetical protein